MLLYAPVSTVRFSLRRSISSGTARGRWAQPPFPRSSLRASASAQAPRSWLSSSREELPPHSHLKVPDFGGKGTVLKWLKVSSKSLPLFPYFFLTCFIIVTNKKAFSLLSVYSSVYHTNHLTLILLQPSPNLGSVAAHVFRTVWTSGRG